MPVSSVELSPNVMPPLESAPAKESASLQSIKQIATNITGETPKDPVNRSSKIVIEVAPQTEPAAPAPVPQPSFWSGLSHSLERFGNWRRTFLLNRFGTTNSSQGLEATVERAVDKAEQQGNQITTIKT